MLLVDWNMPCVEYDKAFFKQTVLTDVLQWFSLSCGTHKRLPWDRICLVNAQMFQTPRPKFIAPAVSQTVSENNSNNITRVIFLDFQKLPSEPQTTVHVFTGWMVLVVTSKLIFKSRISSSFLWKSDLAQGCYFSAVVEMYNFSNYCTLRSQWLLLALLLLCLSVGNDLSFARTPLIFKYAHLKSINLALPDFTLVSLKLLKVITRI